VVQEPLENLSQNAQRVHAYLLEDPERTSELEEIAERVGLTQGETADALRGLEAATRAAESFGGWAVVL
jgi:DNA-binding MarR family transcriptional regulator